ncbi:catalase-like [Anticarsia gemmatalis]|uniref:catalase-like n=1 Tax=Anticarsia gemmatalis TaxID=129554 RepID=UPI003F7701E2
MEGSITLIVLSIFLVVSAKADYANISQNYEPASRQLLDFKHHHPVPIGLWTKSSGEPTEIRDINSINSDQFNNPLLVDSLFHLNGERIPERVVHAKGTGAFGYFVVTHDVSKYTYADVFNGVGKKTPLVARLSGSLPGQGGTDLMNEFKGLSIKMYTKDGNLDLVAISTPIYLYRDANLFPVAVHLFKKNPKTALMDFTALWDGITKRPEILHAAFWIFSDYGTPDGYRKMDAFPIHTFELANKHGETHYVKFNFRTEQGFSSLTTAGAASTQALDLDYFTRDLYNNIEEKNYPSWLLEMDVMTKHDLVTVDYDPFDVTRLWKNGTFFTVPIGRVVLNRNVENQFRDVEQSAYNPAHLVPGIPGPVDWLFRARRISYQDAQNYRIGRNHNKIFVNTPLYAKTYNRDGTPPLRMNGRDSPNYFVNSFHGPSPYVDARRPEKKLLTMERSAVDLEPSWYFYNHILQGEDHKLRFITTLSNTLVPVTPPVYPRVLHLLSLVDKDLATRVAATVEPLRAAAAAQRAAAAAAPKPPVTNVVTVQNDKKHDEEKKEL